MKNVSSTIIIPTFNSERYLEKTLQCLAQSTVKDFCVLIIDDNSTDRSIRIAEDFKKHLSLEILIKPTKRQHGASESLNLAFERISTPFLALIDSDAYLAPDWLEVMQRNYRNNSVSGAPILAYNGTSIWGYVAGLDIESRYHRLIDQQKLLHLSTCNLYGATAIFKTIKLDPTLYYGYDHQLSYLLNRRDINFRLCKSTHCYHHNKTSFWGIARQQYHIALNQFRLSLRFPRESSRKDDISPLSLAAQIPLVLATAAASFWSLWAIPAGLAIIALLNLYLLSYLFTKHKLAYLFPTLIFIWQRAIVWTFGILVSIFLLILKK